MPISRGVSPTSRHPCLVRSGAASPGCSAGWAAAPRARGRIEPRGRAAREENAPIRYDSHLTKGTGATPARLCPRDIIEQVKQMDSNALSGFVGGLWDEQIVPQITEYIRIPNKSPMFDAQWAEHGYMDQAVALMEAWAKAQPIPGMQLEVVRLPGRTPLIFIEIPGQGEDTVLLYGHLDKQPEMTGWSAHLGPWTPVLDGDRLYGRGGADDGYAIFGSLAAIMALQAQGIAHARCVVMIEACEESGSYDLPYYVDHLAARIGKPSLIVCLDSGCGNYDQLWLTTSLRGLTGGNLTVTVLEEGVHSGDASGVVASSFRILRQVLSRLEDEVSGRIKPQELHVEIPAQRVAQAQRTAQILGDAVYSKFPLVDGMRPMEADLAELVLNRTWRPALSVTGIAGVPPLDAAGNVLRPYTSVKLSLRVPPTLDAAKGGEFLKRLLEKDPPYGAKVTFDLEKAGSGWEAPALAPWLEAAVDAASQQFFGAPAAYNGEGGSIPFMGMLGEKFPGAQFLITGVLGPHSNAHGPNEFLHIPTGKRMSMCVARVVADHYAASSQGLTRGVAASHAHTVKGGDGCCD
jgi:acetylornithine deacetylase/succinyl-diaminopimelate desuccinylase-like protein